MEIIRAALSGDDAADVPTLSGGDIDTDQRSKIAGNETDIGAAVDECEKLNLLL